VSLKNPSDFFERKKQDLLKEEIAQKKVEEEKLKNKKFFEDKIETANFFFNRVLPRIDSHYKSAISGSKYIMDFKFN